MQTIRDALKLLKRQTELESAIKEPGGVHIKEEQELQILTRQLERFPEATQAVLQAAHALRRPVTTLSAHDVESWASTARIA